MKSSGIKEDETQMDPTDLGDESTQDENLFLGYSKGESVILPRIGDEFQVQLPPLIGNAMYMSEATFPSYVNFLIGLPVPLTCISLNDKNLVGCSCQISSSNHLENGTVSRKSAMAKILENICKCNCLLVPRWPGMHWSESEKNGFLLGMYIFEKDFIEIRKFLETKGTGALLSYYYGKFYGSQQYRRWSDCRKVKGKKGVYGRRLFSGLRQQELLSRILPRVSEENQTELLEASKTFADEMMSLADYVFLLKKMVGIHILVEAVGIGTGKHDLTTMALETTRSNQGMPVRPEIPIGKACSKLTATEIIKFLSGDYRLSKARSSDLFWEAVWPRLLARGWHSEQPKDQGHYAGAKNSLVFIVPDIKKFSRRKLVKGDHYFDSVTDLLSKVAHEPGLIRLENEGDDDNVKKEEYAWNNGSVMEQEYIDQPARQKPCFLQPKTPKRNITVMKFTVIDTMSEGKIMEYRALPSEVSVLSTAHVYDEINAESNMVNSVDGKKANFVGKTFPGKKEDNIKTTYQDSCSATLAPESKKRKNVCKKHPSEKILKSQKLKCTPGNHIVPNTKRCRILSACNQEETNTILPRTSIGSKVDTETQGCCSGGTNEVEISSSRMSTCADKLSSAGSCRSSPMESVENSHPSTLNLPCTSPDSRNIIFTKEKEGTSVKEEDISLPESSYSGIPTKRSRALTSRAMEALVNGYLTVNRRRKSETILPSRRPQRARVRTMPEESMYSSADSQAAETENGCLYSKGDANGSAHFQVPKQENEEAVSEHFIAANEEAMSERRKSL